MTVISTGHNSHSYTSTKKGHKRVKSETTDLRKLMGDGKKSNRRQRLMGG